MPETEQERYKKIALTKQNIWIKWKWKKVWWGEKGGVHTLVLLL